jgi:hypothetical protein
MVSLYMKNTMIAIALVVAIPILLAAKVKARGDYPFHDHPFAEIGSSYSQVNGDNKCRQIYKDKGGHNTRDDNPLGNLVASDGVVVNGASHVWYHQFNGDCIATTAYQSHEYPFAIIGSSYPQVDGDKRCSKIFKDKGGHIISGGNVVYANDRKTILNGANHVWYHQQRGECVANKMGKIQ